MLAPLAPVAAPAVQPVPATALTVQALAYRRVAPSRDGAAVPHKHQTQKKCKPSIN